MAIDLRKHVTDMNMAASRNVLKKFEIGLGLGLGLQLVRRSILRSDQRYMISDQ